jgi:3-methylcrotonyl-CoA carboxylase alpha subunit
VDSGVREGDVVGTHYDPMIAKLVTHGPDRETALAMMRKALAETQVRGLGFRV